MKPEEEQEEEKNPLWRYIIAPVIILLILLMIIPFYSIKLDPEPRNIPTLEEALPLDLEIEKIDVKTMRDLVLPTNPFIKQMATKIASQSCDEGKVCHAKAVYYFVRDSLQYVADPIAMEYIEHPLETLDNGGGDCESGALVLASMLEAVGVDAQLVFIPNHALVRIKLDEALKKYKRDDYIYLDWTCSKCDFGEVTWNTINSRTTVMEVP